MPWLCPPGLAWHCPGTPMALSWHSYDTVMAFPWHCHGTQDTAMVSWLVRLQNMELHLLPLSCWLGTGITAWRCSVGLCRNSAGVFCQDEGFALPTCVLYQPGFQFLSKETTKTELSRFLDSSAATSPWLCCFTIAGDNKIWSLDCRFERTSLQKSALCKKLNKFQTESNTKTPIMLKHR